MLTSAFTTDPRRVVDEAECVASVLLAILFAHLIGASNISWAAFSGYMVMRGHLAESLLRGALRIIGTGTGALLAFMLVPWAARGVAQVSLALALAGGLTLYAALTARRAYAWLFVGLTFVMILLDRFQQPRISLRAFAETRLLEVSAGTASCLLVSILSTLTLRRIWPAERGPAAAGLGWHPHAARHAAQAAVALLILPGLGIWLELPALAQSAVAIMAVMLVPAANIGASGFVPVSRRLLNRVLGCLAGAGLAAIFLFASRQGAAMLIVGTIFGVAAGRHIENGKGGLAYAGTQFVLAILVTLVPDSYADAHIAPAVDRLIGTLVGMALLEPVLLAWHLVAPAAYSAAGRVEAEAGGV